MRRGHQDSLQENQSANGAHDPILSSPHQHDLHPIHHWRPSSSSRNQLSLFESWQLHLRFFRRGLSDASKWETILDVLAANKALRSNIIQNATLQVVLLTSVASFDVLPSLVHGDISHLRIFFDIFWLYPISLISTIWNGFLSFRVAKSIFTTSHHARRISTFITRPSVKAYRGLTHMTVSESYRILVLLNYFAFSHALARFPYIGRASSFAYCTIANSYYCFERSWTEAGLDFEERVTSLEERWTYHAGFGFAITMISFWHYNFLVNLSLFTLFFPLLLILSSSSSSHPLPEFPNYPLAPSANTADHKPRNQPKISSVFPVRLPVFIISVKLYSTIITFLRPVNHGRSKRDKQSGIFHLNEMEGGISPDLGSLGSRELMEAYPWAAQPVSIDNKTDHPHSDASQPHAPWSHEQVTNPRPASELGFRIINNGCSVQSNKISSQGPSNTNSASNLTKSKAD